MATVDSGANSSNKLTIDPTSKAARVTIYDSGGRELSLQSKATYAAANTFTPAANGPTDMVTITGSPNVTVRVLSFVIIVTNTAAGSQQFFLTKRSTADSGGTSVAGVAVPYDSNDPVANATVAHYTANASTLGTATGNVNIIRVASPVLIPATWAGITNNAGYELLPMIDGMLKPITLRGNTQVLACNFAGVANVAGQTNGYRIVWTEE